MTVGSRVRGASSRLRSVLAEEVRDVDPRVVASRMLLWLVPTGMGDRLRVRVLRGLGFNIGRGTTMSSPIALLGGRRARTNVVIGRRCYINRGCVIDASAPVTIGDGVALGHEVLITTSGHEMDISEHRAGELEPRPVVVESGAWIASRAVLLPGVTVGRGSVVCAGAVVTKSVPADTMVGGVPARVIRPLDASPS